MQTLAQRRHALFERDHSEHILAARLPLHQRQKQKQWECDADASAVEHGLGQRVQLQDAYQLLAMLYKRKKAFINSHVLNLIFWLAVCHDYGKEVSGVRVFSVRFG